jgi:hypothetical protein
MIKKTSVIISLFLITGCGLSHALEEARAGNEGYRACVLQQVETYSASYGTSGRTVEKAIESVISACRQQEEAYVVAITDLAITITGRMVSREKFLEDEEVTLRSDLHDLAASLVERN